MTWAEAKKRNVWVEAEAILMMALNSEPEARNVDRIELLKRHDWSCASIFGGKFATMEELIINTDEGWDVGAQMVVKSG